MLAIQQELEKIGLEQVIAQYSLKASRSAKYPGLVHLSYTFDSPMNVPAVQQCRGLIIREDDFTIVAYPYNKFFNLHEGNAAPIDWKTACVQEKLDGSLIILWHYQGAWHVSTSGSIDASGEVNDFGFTFEELFWKTWVDLDYDLEDVFTDFTYMFELMTPYNQIVVKHPKSRIVLHGARSLKADMKEFDPEFFTTADAGLGYNWVRAETYPLHTVEEVLAAADKVNPKFGEGFVVSDKDFNRIKIKSPAYVALHHIKDKSTSRKYLLDVALAGEAAEMAAYFPEIAPMLMDLALKVDICLTSAEYIYEKYNPLESQKEFALEAVKHPFSALLFGRRNGKITDWKKHLRESNRDNVLAMLDKVK
jgi:hypothetical protein